MTSPSKRSLGRHLVGVFVVLHVVSVALSSLPSVRGNLSPSMMREPVVQHELRQWTRALEQLGLEVTTREFQDFIVALGHLYSDVRDVLVKPFEPYRRHLGTGQTWNLFTSAHRIPSRLEIDLEEGGAFRPLYVARSDEHTWRRASLDDTRMRKAVYFLSWRRASRTYGTFAEWVAREAAEDFPDATRVRVRYWRYETPSPEQVRRGEEPEGRYVKTKLLELARYRAPAEAGR